MSGNYESSVSEKWDRFYEDEKRLSLKSYKNYIQITLTTFHLSDPWSWFYWIVYQILYMNWSRWHHVGTISRWNNWYDEKLCRIWDVENVSCYVKSSTEDMSCWRCVDESNDDVCLEFIFKDRCMKYWKEFICIPTNLIFEYNVKFIYPWKRFFETDDISRKKKVFLIITH